MIPMRAGTLSCLLLLACAGPPPRAADLPLGDPAACHIEIGALRDLDVAIAIDGSRSTSRPSGHDIDRDGEVGTLFDAGSTDPLDSILAAEVAGVRNLVHALAGEDVRFSIVTLSGRSLYPRFTRPTGRIVRREQARIRTPMTDDRDELERGLDAALATGGEGLTDFAAAMNLAIRTLEEAPERPSSRRRVVLFLSDSATPLVAAPRRHPYPYATSGAVDRFDPLMKQEAERAIRRGVRFLAFALGPATGDEPPHPLTRIAGATGGSFRAVEDPTRLHCALLAELGAIGRTARQR
jgi:hypothetical protein